MAQTEAIGLRIAKEKAVRMVDLRNAGGLDKVLKDADRRYTSETSRTALAQWRVEIDDLSKMRERLQRRAKQRSWLSFAKVLERRRQAALQRADGRATPDYDRLIEEAKKKAAEFRRKPVSP